MRRKYGLLAICFLLTVFLLQACGSAESAKGGLSAAFDPENPQEYGIRGIYLGQNVKEAMDVLKPAKADFMDAVTRESYTLDQMASGAGTVVMGLLLVDDTQLIVMVKQGVLKSIAVGGVPPEKAAQFATNRGLAVYDSFQRLQELYGQAKPGQEVSLQGSKYKALFSIHDDKVIGFRFDTIGD
ncbi:MULTISPECIES: hypothetical protein [Brevibacillus]|jgi:hypothetical protein|uniref:Lipoprotein n=1 Tax=Brevibacillus borstelensis AK1 TaxID=1300222 RepID=M8DDX4_9BACL|nr:hypothetical protein [Brevibacillus borstelensis]EMT54529.1 hypothetical protein I532_02955 [Brevibacillus borstelensis AK1]KKX54368.1 hypothetical protein X546_15175 [Brevibacillus borstelensis cifa_chp40]MBE5395927.1 hypothetical protein [Brevibacillus borstelensis]MCC0563253.1 hypothetical protein [Brevibacillus borstelensis]MCM3471274.1 hypothetical protein [Brevibacillus borstelensis]